MDTRRPPASRRRQTFSDFHLLLLSIAIGFCISFGGGLILVEQILSASLATSVHAELVEGSVGGGVVDHRSRLAAGVSLPPDGGGRAAQD